MHTNKENDDAAIVSTFTCNLSDAEQCDWPDNTVCKFDASKAREKKITAPTFLYLTFDDGPNEGTPYVLEVLRVSHIHQVIEILLHVLFMIVLCC